MKKGKARPPVSDGRSTEQCGSAREETKKPKEDSEVSPAFCDAAWSARLKAVQDELQLPKQPRGPRVGEPHPFVRKQIKKVLPAVCNALLVKAQKGDLPTVKLLWQMAELDKQTESTRDKAKDRKFVQSAMAKYHQR